MKYDKVCHFCKREIPFETRILRTETCPWCRSDLHVCLNCKHHNTSRHNECEVPNTDRIKHRDRANFCGAFEFRSGKPEENSEAKDAKAKLNDLFKF